MKQITRIFTVFLTAATCFTSITATVPAQENVKTITVDCAENIKEIKNKLTGVSVGGNTYSFEKREIVEATKGRVPFVRMEGVGGPGYDIYNASNGEYNFDRFFAEIDNIHETGAEIIADIFFMPDWISGDKEGKYGEVWASPPEDYVKWQDYIYNIVYNVNIANDGKRRIDYWEIWNEPSGNFFFSRWNDGLFHEFYSKTAEAIKRADPTAKVGGYADNAWYQDGLEWAEYQAAHNTVPDFLSLHFYGEWVYAGTPNPLNWPEKYLTSGVRNPSFYDESTNTIMGKLEKIFGKTLPVFFTEWNANAEGNAIPMDVTTSYMAQTLYYMQKNDYIDGACYFRVEPFYGAFSVLDENQRDRGTARVLAMFQKLEQNQVKAEFNEEERAVVASANDDRTKIGVMVSRHDFEEASADKEDTRIEIKNHNIDGQYAVKLYTEDLQTRDDIGKLHPDTLVKGTTAPGETITVDLGFMRKNSVKYVEVYADDKPMDEAVEPAEVFEADPNPLNTVFYSFDDITGEDEAVDGVHEGIDFGNGKWKSTSDGRGLNRGAYPTDENAKTMSFELPDGNYLKSVLVAGSKELEGTTLVISSDGNADVTVNLNLYPKTVETSWSKESKVVTLKFEKAGGGVDQIKYEPVFDPKPGENLLRDGGMETGKIDGWTYGGVANNNAHSGRYAIQIKNGWTFFGVNGLKPNTEYRYSAWVKNTAPDDLTYLGCKEYGDRELLTNTSGGVTDYVQLSVNFKTGADNTSVTIFIGKNSGSDLTYADDFEVVEVVYADTEDGDESNENTTEQNFEFGDIFGHWAENDIKTLAAKKIVSGNGNGEYHPDYNITRSEFLSMVNKALNLRAVVYSSDFADVSGDEWYANIIQTAINNGLIDSNLTENKLFKPNDLLTREEMASILMKAYKKLYITVNDNGNIKRFSDWNYTAGWAMEYMNQAEASGMISGVTSTRLEPKGYLTRAQAAAVVNRLLGN